MHEIKLLLAIIFSVYFFVVVTALNILRKDISFLKSSLSIYNHGKSGIFLSTAFVLIGCSEIIISYILQNNYLAITSLFLSGIGVIIVGFVKMDLKNLKSFQNYIHNLGVVLQFLFFPIAVFLLAFEQDFLLLKYYYLITALTTFILGIYMFIFYNRYINNRHNYYGLVQKINIFLINLWLIIVPILMLG